MGRNHKVIYNDFKYKAIVTSVYDGEHDENIKEHYNKVGSYLIDNDINCDFVFTKYQSKYSMMVSSIKFKEL